MTKVTMYSKANCPPCKQAKYWFDKKGIEYEEIPLDGHRQYLHDKGFPPIAPTFEYKGKITQKLTTVVEWLQG